jgi:hypothetical protein
VGHYMVRQLSGPMVSADSLYPMLVFYSLCSALCLKYSRGPRWCHLHSAIGVNFSGNYWPVFITCQVMWYYSGTLVLSRVRKGFIQHT